jgi:hypothetical protein
MFLTPQDFTGKYELHTGLYDQTKLQDYINKYEKRYLIELFGATLFDDFIADLDVNNEPESPNFIQIFDEFHQNVNLYHLLLSEGILEMLKGFIYFEYSKDQMNQQTPFGNVSQLSENSKKVTTLNSMMFTRYNEAVKTYNAIRDFMILNSTLHFGQVIYIMQESIGSGYVTSNNVQVNQIGMTSDMTVTSIGTGYVNASNVPTLGGNGIGLTLNIIQDGFGGIDSFTIASAGSGYAVDDIITVDAGGQDATLLVTNVINSSVGSGFTLDFIANGIDGCNTFTPISAGSGYVTTLNVPTFGGSGSDLTVNVIQDGVGGVLSMTIAQTGFGYLVGETITINGGNSDATFQIDTLTNGEVTSIVVNEDGIDYLVNEEFIIDGGDNNCKVKLVKVGAGDFRKFNGIRKLFAYWI